MRLKNGAIWFYSSPRWHGTAHTSSEADNELASIKLYRKQQMTYNQMRLHKTGRKS